MFIDSMKFCGYMVFIVHLYYNLVTWIDLIIYLFNKNIVKMLCLNF